jgi:uncharacterized protein (DUF1015 family)
VILAERCHPVQVPRFEPFRALRYSPSLPLDEVAAPPYDVLSEADVDALSARHPRNIVLVDVPRESDGEGRYDLAARRLGEWMADGTLTLDDAPSFTLYRMRFTDDSGRARETVGVIGGLEVIDEGAPGVLPHERTTPKAKSDRLDLTRATRTNLSPVWGLSLAAGLTELLAPPAEAVGRVIDEDGVEHTVERVSDPARVAAISAAIGTQPVVIADGHHRYAISRTYRDEVRTATADTGTPAELTMTYVAELVADQLSVEAIHRLFTGITASELLDALSRSFDTMSAGLVGPTTLTEMASRGTLCLVRPDGTGMLLRPRPAAFAGVRDLDSARLEHSLADVDHTVAYQHGVGHVLDAVTSGAASAGILIRPVSVAEIRRTADEGLLMPPKSTFFTPKLRTGLVLRPLTP